MICIGDTAHCDPNDSLDEAIAPMSAITAICLKVYQFAHLFKGIIFHFILTCDYKVLGFGLSSLFFSFFQNSLRNEMQRTMNV